MHHHFNKINSKHNKLYVNQKQQTKKFSKISNNRNRKYDRQIQKNKLIGNVPMKSHSIDKGRSLNDKEINIMISSPEILESLLEIQKNREITWMYSVQYSIYQHPCYYGWSIINYLFDEIIAEDIKKIPMLTLSSHRKEYSSHIKMVNNHECIVTNNGTIGSYNFVNDGNAIIFCGYNKNISFMAKLSLSTNLFHFFVQLMTITYEKMNISNFKCYLLGTGHVLFNDILDYINIANDISHQLFEICGQACTTHLTYESIILDTKIGIVSQIPKIPHVVLEDFERQYGSFITYIDSKEEKFNLTNK
jgi:hypothetical protein